MTDQPEEMITMKRARFEVDIVLQRFALLYMYFAQTLVEELGEAEGKRLVSKAVERLGMDRGSFIREGVKALGLECVPENFGKIQDETALSWVVEHVEVDGEARRRTHRCALADVWMERGAEELGRLYCWIDQAKHHTFSPEYRFLHTANVLDGDEFCEFAERPVSELE
jgi:hypothetical protein